ncbi:TonB-dependent receptor [Novosphingobium sp. Rr 2-17]|uniref:TonB-dependent receptor n=1 Tax=Novosphingobium sp. Rr 2-17 TaxID=555793 RepID=UPI00026998F0|nr:TonB-dependent receptor [Novosphingobium sp. Rr 2-17]EIZ77410.1 TonB-dependent receptor [Novosphingobium sp. Rr 2-17]
MPIRSQAGAFAVRCRAASVILSVAAILGSVPAFAQTQAEAAPASTANETADTSLTIGEILVTGQRYSSGSNASRVLTSVDILSGSIAQRENVDAAFQLFSRLPGVLTTNFGQGPSNDGSIAFRGFNGEGGINAVKLLIDGIPSNTNDGFTWMLDAVQPMDIERIEVVRGTSDPRYGLHNIAGNVSIDTRQGGTYLDAKLSGGSFGTYEGQAAAGYQKGDFSQNYFAGYRHTDGYRDHAQGDRTTLSGKWFYSPGSFRLGAIARYYHGKGQEPGYLSAEDAKDSPRTSYAVSQNDGGTRTIQQYSLHADGEVAPNLTASANLYFVDYADVRFVRFSESVSQQERVTQQRQYGGLAHLNWTPDIGSTLHALSVEVGGDFQIQHNDYNRYRTTDRVRTGQTISQNFDLSVYGAYIQAVIEPTEWLRITPAYRVDWVDGNYRDLLTGERYGVNQYGTIGQPKISAAITPVKGVTAYANYGRTFQIGLGSSSYLIPPQTTSLDASYNDGWELGVKFAHGGWFEGRVAAWKQVASGEVQYNELDATYSNLGRTRRVGFDAQANFNPTKQLSFWIAVAKQHGRIVENPAAPQEEGNKIDHVPEYIVSGGIDYKPTDKLRLTLLGNGQTDYELDTSNEHGRFGSFAVFNAEVAYKLTPKVELSGQIRNLTNDKYSYVWWDGEQTLHAPADGRAIYGSVRVTL